MMGFHKSITRQEERLKELRQSQRTSIDKIAAFANKLADGVTPISVKDANQLAHEVKVLLARCRSYDNVGAKLDILG